MRNASNTSNKAPAEVGLGMNTMQALVDGLGAAWQRERAGSQFTLGTMIEALENMDGQGAYVDALCDPHSYRGYYCDLAFEPAEGRVLVSDLLAVCRSALGEVFEGYKGGDYTMGKSTPVWISYYGSTGRKIVGIDRDGHWLTEADE